MVFVVFGMREESQRKNLAGVEVNGGNEAEIVFADIENDPLRPPFTATMSALANVFRSSTKFSIGPRESLPASAQGPPTPSETSAASLAP